MFRHTDLFRHTDITYDAPACAQLARPFERSGAATSLPVIPKQ
ncbi:hypothetical protein [Persicimonas caeni]|nr:hypothetical protein [Persicimonas caeni]